MRQRGLNQLVGLEANQTARGGRSELRHNGHERTGADVAVDDVVRFAKDATVNSVSDAVAETSAGMLQKGAGEESFAFGCDCDFDRIVHTAGHHRFNRTTVDATAEDVRGGGLQLFAIQEFVVLFCKGSFAPVDPAVAT